MNEPNKLEYLPLVSHSKPYLQTLDEAERLATDKHSSLLVSYERKKFYKIGLRGGFCHVQVKKLLKWKSVWDYRGQVSNLQHLFFFVAYEWAQ